MERRTTSSGLLSFLALLAAATPWIAGCHADATVVSGKPNLVLVSVDTLRPDELRAFDPGAQRLPYVDGYAAGAARFTHAFSTASWTLPAHGSILTGLYPHHHGAVHPDVGLAPDVPTLAEALGAAGYRTVAFTHGGFLRPAYGLGRGFDVYDRERSATARLPGLSLPRDGRVPRVRGENLFDREIAFLEAHRDSDPPFFLFAHTYNVHDYFKVNRWVQEPDDTAGPDKASHYLECLMGHQRCSEEEWSRLRRYYRAEIRHFDEGFGHLLAALHDHVRGPTYVMLVSDHGEGFDPEHGRTHHGGRLHDDVIRVPFLLAGPGVAAGRVDTPVSLVDVAPTLLALAKVAPPPGLDGRSVLAPPPGDEEGPRTLFASEYTTVYRSGELFALAAPGNRPLSVAVISGDRRLITHREATELYRVTDDPGERDDLSSAEPELVLTLLRQALPLLRHRLTLHPLEPTSTLREELESLGYL